MIYLILPYHAENLEFMLEVEVMDTIKILTDVYLNEFT